MPTLMVKRTTDTGALQRDIYGIYGDGGDACAAALPCGTVNAITGTRFVRPLIIPSLHEQLNTPDTGARRQPTERDAPET